MRNPIRKALTRTVQVQHDRKRIVELEYPPSNRLVYGMYVAITTLVGLVTLEALHIVVLRSWNSEVFSAITGLIGTISGVFITYRT